MKVYLNIEWTITTWLGYRFLLGLGIGLWLCLGTGSCLHRNCLSHLTLVRGEGLYVHKCKSYIEPINAF